MKKRRMTRVFEGKREDGQDVDHVDVEGEYGRYIAIKNISSGKTTNTLLERRIEQRNI